MKDSTTKIQTVDEIKRVFIEKGAALEHARWARWHVHMIGKQTFENLKRWERQAVTPYEELSEPEKESDRREVREYLPLVDALFDSLLTSLIAEIEASKRVNDSSEDDKDYTPKEIVVDILTLAKNEDIDIIRSAMSV